MSRRSKTLSCPDEQATGNIAEALGAGLRPGDTVLLEGGIGAGKTFFARHLIQSLLLVPEDVPSPTYTLVQVYDAAPGEIWHCDLYRLSDPSQCIELGLEDAFDTAICLVEWPDRLGSLAPVGALTIALAATGTEGARTLELSWTDPKWETRLEGVAT